MIGTGAAPDRREAADGRMKQLRVRLWVARSSPPCASAEEMQRWAVGLPHVNQIEVHPWQRRSELLALCASLGIAVVAYGSLGGNRHAPEILRSASMRDIAAGNGCSPAQLLLRPRGSGRGDGHSARVSARLGIPPRPIWAARLALLAQHRRCRVQAPEGTRHMGGCPHIIVA